nr:YebC/PmpR family DNA-binding transcriptional regulator [Thermodesulfobium narugense]
MRGRIFTKLARELTVAARTGGGNPEANPRLRIAIEKAKSVNMPSDNIKRAIQKGTGELNDGTNYEELMYEGYGPFGIAVLMQVTTDNKNRTAPEIRKIFSKYGGSMAEAGAVAWMFSRKGEIIIDGENEEKIMELALEEDLFVDDVEQDEGETKITTEPENLYQVQSKLKEHNFNIISCELVMVPSTYVQINNVSDAKKVLSFLEQLEDHDDIQNVYSNFDIPDEIMKEVEKEN